MAKATVKVAGLRELGENLRALQVETRDKILRKAVRDSGKVVAERAKQIALSKGLYGDEPVHMVNAIRARRLSRVSKNGLEMSVVGVFKIPGGKYANTKLNRRKGRVGKQYQVDPPEFYWKFHEFGAPGANIPKRAFLVPAFDATKGGIPDIMAKAVDEGTKRALRRVKKPARMR